MNGATHLMSVTGGEIRYWKWMAVELNLNKTSFVKQAIVWCMLLGKKNTVFHVAE